jgi:UDP-glucose 4-epimerase
MITGGLGFIGSNLAHKLVGLGARVLLVDGLIPDCGGNLQNISGIQDQVTLRIADVREASTMTDLVSDQQVIFNLAGQVSHVDSMRNPRADLAINCESHLSLLEACRYHKPDATVVYASTRQVYGRPEKVPVTERDPVRPIDINGVNKAAGESYHRVYHDVFGVHTVTLRLTNIYGPRQLVSHNRQGFIGWFVGQAAQGRDIPVYGDGAQIRDLVYVDDAVDAFLRVGADAACNGVFNVGGDEPICHRDLAALLIDVAGSGRVRYVEWPDERKTVDVGSVYVDSSKLREMTNWRPRVRLREGLGRAVAFYRRHPDSYLTGEDTEGIE